MPLLLQPLMLAFDALEHAARQRRVSEPNRRALSSAIGRAPIVKMSRMMPPTPVAAPWYG
jgi:hypothetical protein